MDQNIVNQQQFLQEQNMYSGTIDGYWGPDSRAAMLAWSCISNSGHADGTPFDGRKPLPEGYGFVNQVFTKLEESDDAKAESDSVPTTPTQPKVVAPNQQGLSSVTLPKAPTLSLKR